MKQLVKPKTKKMVFDAVNVHAFHERNGVYTQTPGNTGHVDAGVVTFYDEWNNLDISEDVLF